MANNAINNNKQLGDLVLTGKPVLVQNSLGIFYGFLEKSDSRSATALLRDGFMLSPDNHITFSQYLDFLSYEIDDMYEDIKDRFDESITESEDDQVDDDSMLYESIVPNEIIVDQNTFNEHKRCLTITDYASDGVFLVQHRASTHENSKYLQSVAPLISLTNVIAIVAISEHTINNLSILNTEQEIEDEGLIASDIYFYNSLTSMITFGMLNNDLRILILVSLMEKANSLEDTTMDKYMKDFKADESSLVVTCAFDYIRESLIRQFKKNHSIDDDKNLPFKEMKQFFRALANIPSLVVNSEKRVKLYDDLKMAQSNEQDK